MESSDTLRFEQLILPHLDAGYGLARYLLWNDDDARDVVQEGALRAYRAFGGYRGGDARAWFLAIVRNTAYSWRRKHRRDAEWEEFDEELHGVPSPARDADLDRLGATELVQNALGKLAPEFRDVIVLRELEGLSYKEIGEATGVPVGTVMSRLSRARKRLEELLLLAERGTR